MDFTKNRELRILSLREKSLPGNTLCVFPRLVSPGCGEEEPIIIFKVKLLFIWNLVYKRRKLILNEWAVPTLLKVV